MKAAVSRYDIPVAYLDLFGITGGLKIAYFFYRIATWIGSKFNGPSAGGREFWFMLILFGPIGIRMILDVLSRVLD